MFDTGFPNEEYFMEQEEAAKESIEFFSNHKKKRREKEILDHWLKATRPELLEKHIAEQERPDFVINSELEIEIVEVLDPIRKRHDEYKEDLKLARKKQLSYRPYREQYFKDNGARWITDEIIKKIKKYKSKTNLDVSSWILVVYADFQQSSNIKFGELIASIAQLNPPFKKIDIIYCDFSGVKTIFPTKVN